MLQWHLVLGGIYKAASEQFVLEVYVLKAEKMDKDKDLTDFDEGYTTGSEYFQNCGSCGMFLFCSGQDLLKVVQGRKTCEPARGS